MMSQRAAPRVFSLLGGRRLAAAQRKHKQFVGPVDVLALGHNGGAAGAEGAVVEVAAGQRRYLLHRRNSAGGTRHKINPRNLLFAGFELEGQSYRLWNNPVSASSAQMDLRGEELEIRRGEIRARLVYECSLKNFVWMSLQAGYRVNYRYDVDRLVDGAEIYRAFGILRDDPYAVTNSLGNPFYVNLSFNLVSP